MKRTMFAMLTVAALTAASAPAFAAGGVTLGLGYFRPEAPIGGRAWLNDKVAIDAGIGIENKEMSYTANGAAASEKKTSFMVDAGLPYVVAGDETTKFFVRPGVTFHSMPVWDSAADDWATSKQFWVSGTLGVEHWFGKRFSLAAGHGLVFKSMDPGTKGSETSSEFSTEALSLTSIGFHFYFI